jgi:hypothetical protein
MKPRDMETILIGIPRIPPRRTGESTGHELHVVPQQQDNRLGCADAGKVGKCGGAGPDCPEVQYWEARRSERHLQSIVQDIFLIIASIHVTQYAAISATFYSQTSRALLRSGSCSMVR